MGRLDDKIISIRFNPREYLILKKVLDARYQGFWDSRCSIIKDIILEEYNRLYDTTSCNTQRSD